MSIESIQGKRKYRLHPENNCVVQIQRGVGARWQDYRQASSWTEASKLVLALAQGKDETQELEAVQE